MHRLQTFVQLRLRRDIVGLILNFFYSMISYFQDIEHHIIKHIQLAESRLLIAVAWFTNTNIGKEIIKKNSLDIEIIVDDNKINRECKNLLELQSNNVDLTFVKDLTKNYYLMHNKFCVIDNKIVITGSYNWTHAANSNDENITISIDCENAALYTHEFRRIKHLKFPNENIFLSDEESNEITEIIYDQLLLLLKANINSLEKRLFFDWTNEKIKNKIRVIDERLRNTLQSKVGQLGIYMDLIGKYGFEYKLLSTEQEKVEARDNFRKKGLDEIDFYLHREFQFFKLKAIKKLQDNYGRLLEKESTDFDRMQKIVKVHSFITKEKNDIAIDIKLTAI